MEELSYFLIVSISTMPGDGLGTKSFGTIYAANKAIEQNYATECLP
jgi:hypothetical protein